MGYVPRTNQQKGKEEQDGLRVEEWLEAQE
jgi:hypothetical protein